MRLKVRLVILILKQFLHKGEDLAGIFLVCRTGNLGRISAGFRFALGLLLGCFLPKLQGIISLGLARHTTEGKPERPAHRFAFALGFLEHPRRKCQGAVGGFLAVEEREHLRCHVGAVAQFTGFVRAGLIEGGHERIALTA